jgi:hypothetical protein
MDARRIVSPESRGGQQTASKASPLNKNYEEITKHQNRDNIYIVGE